VGPPFTTRRLHDQGLSFPKFRTWGIFTCESCTVRAIVGRELHQTQDSALLALERMRTLDMAHSWARSTHAGYQTKMTIIQSLEDRLGVSLLPLARLPYPRHAPDIVLMWIEEAYSLQPGVSRDQTRDTVSYNTIRQLRAAVSQRLTWDATQQPHVHAYLDHNKRLLQDAGRFTDELPSQLHAQGMAIRLGTEALPSKALLDRHIRELDEQFLMTYRRAQTPQERHAAALGGFANLILWLGWLRAGETFTLTWKDVVIVHPLEGPTVGLPAGVGMVGLRLTPETKSSRAKTSDVVLAYSTVSGLCVGKWATRAAKTRPSTATDSSLIFSHLSGARWTSLSYRRTILYPFLTNCKSQGDPYLQPVSSIPDSFWSLHSYRRGSRSHVSRRRKVGNLWTRRASTTEVYEHARWRRKRSGEKVDVIYQEWDYEDRVQLTLFCM
jgi:hypothetical protein